MTDRREFLRHSALASSGLLLSPWLKAALGAPASEKPPLRFIFMHKGNGLFPKVMVPTTLSKEDQEKEERKDSFQVNLRDHELPAWMSPLNEHKDSLTILQGLSGKMCTTGHHTWQSSLGVYKANERLSSIKWATVDFELAKLCPSPLEHIELACFPIGGGNARGNINGIEMGFSARGPQQPNYAFGSPKVAMQELFKSVSANNKDQIKYQLERKILEFTAGSQASLAADLQGKEKLKLTGYTDSIQVIRAQNEKIELMGDKIRRYLPKLDDKYFADDITTVDRQRGLTEIMLSTLISGMTNVATFTVDELGTIYTGLPGIEKEQVNLHDVGHGKPVGPLQAEDVRAVVRTQHMTLVDTIIKRLKSVPEADGNMFDNTMLFYFPDNGETHHSSGIEWPFLVFSGRNAKLDIAGRYIRLPKWGDEGHMTLGNWYTTILNAYGNPLKHFGDIDLGLDKLKRDQKGAITQFLG